MAAVGPAPAGGSWVHGADRGADTAEFLARPWGPADGLVLRSQANRAPRRGHAPGGPPGDPHRYARTPPRHGRKEVVVAARPGQPERKATVAVALAPVRRGPPHVRRGLYEQRPRPRWAVRVAEVDAPAGVKPLAWLPLTPREVATRGQARERVRWDEARRGTEGAHEAPKTGCAIQDLRFTPSAALQPRVALLGVVAVRLLNRREASRRPGAPERPAADRVDGRSVAVRSAWRSHEVGPDRSIEDSFHARARRGGHRNRQRDHRPGGLVGWRGWVAWRHMSDGADAIKSCGQT